MLYQGYCYSIKVDKAPRLRRPVLNFSPHYCQIPKQENKMLFIWLTFSVKYFLIFFTLADGNYVIVSHECFKTIKIYRTIIFDDSHYISRQCLKMHFLRNCDRRYISKLFLLITYPKTKSHTKTC